MESSPIGIFYGSSKSLLSSEKPGQTQTANPG